MTANPGSKAGKDGKFIHVVNLKKDGKHVSNYRQWDEGMRLHLSTLSLNHFLDECSGLQVPDSQREQVMMEQLCDAQLYANRSVIAKREKERIQVPVKMEQGPIKVEEDPKTPSKATPRTKESVDKIFGNLSAYEENMKKNSQIWAKKKIEKIATRIKNQL